MTVLHLKTLVELEVPLLAVRVTPLTASELVERLLERPSQASLVLNHNLHSVHLWYTRPTFRSIYDRADIVLVDGWPILKLLRLRDEQWSSEHRIGSTDWLEALMREGGRCSRRLFVVGGDVKTHDEALRRLRTALPTWTVTGVDGYGPVVQDVKRLADVICDFAPDIALIGLGMPRQEAVLHSLVDRLPAAHYVTVGAAVDYIGGSKALSPRWLGRVGLEWMWRLAHEPRRLAWRYCVEPVHLLTVLLTARVKRDGDGLW